MAGLILSRKAGDAESVVVTLPDGRRGRVSVLEVRDGNRVRLRLDFPVDVMLMRNEVQAAIDADDRANPPSDVP